MNPDITPTAREAAQRWYYRTGFKTVEGLAEDIQLALNAATAVSAPIMTGDELDRALELQQLYRDDPLRYKTGIPHSLLPALDAAARAGRQPGNDMSTNPRELFVTVARRFVGIRESSRNRFPGDVKVWASTSYPDGYVYREPYCAAFVCHVVRLADLESMELNYPNPPRSASVAGWRTWARDKKNGVQILTPSDKIMAGDIVSFLPHFSHIGIVRGVAASKVHILTVEANTNDAGSREGDGIYEKSRSLSICGEFYRLPAKATAV